MYDSWTCLSVERGPGMLSDEVRNLLKAAACDLYIKKWDSMHIENDVASGVIKTAWESHVVGGRSGVLFRARVDSKDGTDYQVNFLLSTEDLERGAEHIRTMREKESGAWEDAPGRVPCEALYQFERLSVPSKKRH